MAKLIKIGKLAKDLGVTITTIYNWHSKGKLEFIKSLGGHNFVNEETYNSLLNIKIDLKEDGSKTELN